tara:strand:+ start:37 stop:507 length:471 start_codon:yes stop_codon:yes gene_type:complete
MKKIIILLIIFTSCEKEYNFNEYPKENNIPLNLYPNLPFTNFNNDTIYHYFYPEGNNNSYFAIEYLTTEYQRIFWESPNMFYVIMWGDTIWTPVVDYSTYADENGIGKQIIYVNETLIGDTLNIIAKTNNINNKIVKIIINPDCYPLLCDENGSFY